MSGCKAPEILNRETYFRKRGGDRFEICPQIIQTGVFQQPADGPSETIANGEKKK